MQVQNCLVLSVQPGYTIKTGQKRRRLLRRPGTERRAAITFIGTDAEWGDSMTFAPPGSPPEQGQLVNVRSRQWIVTEVARSTLPTSPLRPSDNAAQDLVSLSSVEDDTLGEELQVIWELEPGAQVIEKVAFPEPIGFDPPDRLDAFLDSVRWGAASTADMRSIQSPYRSGIDIED